MRSVKALLRYDKSLKVYLYVAQWQGEQCHYHLAGLSFMALHTCLHPRCPVDSAFLFWRVGMCDSSSRL